MGKIVLVRHGQASFGKLNYDNLSAIGVKQAVLVAEKLNNLQLTNPEIITGSMLRHKQTASPFLEENKHLIETEDKGFNEYNWEDIMAVAHPKLSNKIAMGTYLLTKKEPKRVFQKLFKESIDLWLSEKDNEKYKENWTQFRERVINSLEKHTHSSLQDKIIFTSGGPISVVTQYVLGLDISKTFNLNWPIVNGSISTFKSQTLDNKTNLYLSSFNETFHLSNETNELITLR